ncbi:aromatic ring-hydroxylating oxygenase subunit alpha [Neptuniibacter caesariensis]|uniref:Rieske domain-containing protein n=1 Tax=Neptuniibacter caesariensis TaxID=207954 RepID=A0A7U8C9K3_NEPCE|nr:aromatic ring-hydroxylating dioxygenase subunit alpha [Neptuniibacter caesariensis]EAR62630.1 hypothetical protein MED92_05913 [Oceanospirillum sp. MED92] [Neptuniibacter caesariensis]
MINLPKDAYTSTTWFEKEQEKIFEQNWQFAGFTSDLNEAGEFLTVQVGRINLIVVKGPDLKIRAFHNQCRHRGTQLLRTCGKAGKALTCPYHDWSYSLEGDLLSVPQQREEFPDLDKKMLGLHRASVSIWKEMIWVHPEPAPEPLTDWLGDIKGLVGPHRVEELIEDPDSATEHEIKANWKIVAENYIDGYHLAHLHSATLNMYAHQQQECGFVGKHFAFYEPLTDKYADNLKEMSPLPPIDHFTEEQPLGAYVPLIFPNLGIGASESSWSIFHIIPLAPNLTRVITRTKVMPASGWAYFRQSQRSNNAFASMSGKYAEGTSPDDPMQSGDFMAEDIFACEQQQKALNSPYFSVGPTAQNQEASVRDFQSIINLEMEQ